MAMDSSSLAGGIKVTSKNLFLRYFGGGRNLTTIMLSSRQSEATRDLSWCNEPDPRRASRSVGMTMRGLGAVWRKGNVY